jgi:hypothetical protein
VVRLIAFCEAPADFRTASGLLDRVLRQDGPSWIADLIGDHPDSVRTWHADNEGRAFFDLHRLDGYVKQLSIRVPHGHFGGRPGGAGALMARNAFHIVRELNRRLKDEAIEAVVLVWDMDDQPDARCKGLSRARAEARSWAKFEIVLGCANPMREAWVLAGFDPADDDERGRLDAARRELGFSPSEQAHRLDAKDEQAKLSAKRILRTLVDDDPDREARCWRETSLETLQARGGPSGLREYLDELRQLVLPRCARATSRPPTPSATP